MLTGGRMEGNGTYVDGTGLKYEGHWRHGRMDSTERRNRSSRRPNRYPKDKVAPKVGGDQRHAAAARREEHQRLGAALPRRHRLAPLRPSGPPQLPSVRSLGASRF